MLGENFFDELTHGSFIRDINGESLETAGSGARRDLQSVQLFLPSIGDDDRGAFLEERQTYGAPQSAGSACHQRHFPFESRIHRGPPCSIFFPGEPSGH